MTKFRNLELHVSHACNLSCESCSHYSNQNHKGNLSLADAEAWIQPWSGKIEPQLFSLMGGEPSLNPALCEFFPLVREYFPNTSIRMVSNGLTLKRHPQLPSVMSSVGNCFLSISIHHASLEYLKKLSPQTKLIRQWIQDYDIDVTFSPSYGGWSRRYIGEKTQMMPYSDNNIQDSWRICNSKYCRQLYEGKIWKCPPVAYLGMQNKKYDLDPVWDPYLNYEPLGPESTAEEIDSFINVEAESVCSMCPSHERIFNKPIPLSKNLNFHSDELEDIDPFLLAMVASGKSRDFEFVKEMASKIIGGEIIQIDDTNYSIDVKISK